ncbi:MULTISPECIES: FAD-dependent monooxygenase [unclassified Mycobacterium]|uniref:FAD-dependent monooxygenase n=1 Tax=unclassified Mycobacterium TaxID=2642494 RepID=UPI000993F0CB|nr:MULTISPECIES: FAD-dependent monooxygenase [unclassified Mycobacterium]
MTEHAVVIAGGGPTGLMLAGELALAGVDVAVLERRDSHEEVGSRAAGVHSRTIEVFDQRGIAERFLSQGMTGQVTHFSGIFMSIEDFPTRHPYALGLLQHYTEKTLAAWIAELGVPIYYSAEVVGFTQDDSGVDVELADGRAMRGLYLIGCDGGRSAIRKAAGIGFPGHDPSCSAMLVDAEITEQPLEFGLLRKPGQAFLAILPFEEGWCRLVFSTDLSRLGAEPTLEEAKEALIAIAGTDFGLHSPRWMSRFSDMTRQADRYRDRRLFLAGDSAHIHFPFGGQGLNTGVQDAVNLGWKLAAVIKGEAPDALLDTYHSERHPVAERVLHNTMAQTPLSEASPRIDALRDIMSDLLAMDEPRKRIAGMMSGLDIHYEVGGHQGTAHPLLGRRMPDLDLVTAEGPTRVYPYLHTARPLLFNFGESQSLHIDGWTDRVQLVDAKYSGAWDLPVLGEVTAPDAVLVRPDGHVAWVGEGSDAGLIEALTQWVGSPVPA